MDDKRSSQVWAFLALRSVLGVLLLGCAFVWVGVVWRVFSGLRANGWNGVIAKFSNIQIGYLYPMEYATVQEIVQFIGGLLAVTLALAWALFRTGRTGERRSGPSAEKWEGP